MTVLDGYLYVSSDGLLVVDAATIEIGDVGTVDEPLHAAVNLLLSGSRQFAEASATDITLGIAFNRRGIRSKVT